MGYTHYINTTKAKISKRAFNKITKDVRIIQSYLAKHEDIELVDVKYKEASLSFNGKGDEGLEDFYIDLKELDEWDCIFCKTGRKDYDLAVCLALMSVKANSAKGVSVKTDGDTEEWEYAFKLFKHLFPKVTKEFKIQKIKHSNYLVT